MTTNSLFVVVNLCIDIKIINTRICNTCFNLSVRNKCKLEKGKKTF